MKLLIVLAALASTSVFANRAVGHIEFQSASTFVNAYYNKTLCLDGTTYKAVVSTCLQYEWSNDDKRCVARGKKMITQPMYSTRLRCASFSGDDCDTYERVSFVQSPNVTVKFYNNDDRVVRTKTITVPSCGFSGK